MVSLFREKTAASVFWLIALSSILHAQFLIHPPEVVSFQGQGFLYELMQPLYLLPPFAIALFYQAIIIIQSLRINYILNDSRMYSKAAFTAAMSYILLTALFPAWNNLTPALFANSLLIWLIQRFMQMYNTPQPRPSIFNTGLITGVAVLLYHPVVIIILLAFLALAILRPFKINEWFVLLLGLATPFYCLVAILFLNDGLKNLIFYLPKFQPHFFKVANRNSILAALITSSVLIIAGIISWQSNLSRMIIQVRKSWSVILLMFLLLLPATFFIKDAQLDALMLCTVPASVFVACIFLYPRMNLFPAILFWGTVAVILYNNWILVKT